MDDLLRSQCKVITKNHNKIFLIKRNVVGMGFGYKIINGINTGELCFKVFVAKKESIASLNKTDLIPKMYNGVKTDVIQTGKITYSSLDEKTIPLKFGYTIGSAMVRGVGTAGCLVKDKCNNYYILTNNHVLTNQDTLPVGTPVLHPGVRDGGKYPDDLIGHLYKAIPILTSTDTEENFNKVDCAIAKVINPRLVTNSIAFIGKIKGVRDGTLDMKVKKTGRTTELTTGIITEIDSLTECITSDGKSQLFEDQIITTYMSTKGDSGSLVLDENNNAIGLLYADSDSYSMLNPIKEVLKALNVTIVTA